MEVTLTFRGDIEEMRRLLSALPEVQALTGTETVVDSTTQAERIRRFLSALTPDGKRVIRRIAESSRDARSLLRNELLAMLNEGKHMNVGVMELSGFLGGIGIHWGRQVGGANPLRGIWDGAAADFRYGLDTSLAQEILDILDELEGS